MPSFVAQTTLDVRKQGCPAGPSFGAHSPRLLKLTPAPAGMLSCVQG